jgi:hypothetical protein
MNGRQYVIDDYSLACDDALWYGNSYFAGFMMFLYAFGVPIGLGAWLYSARRKEQLFLRTKAKDYNGDGQATGGGEVIMIGRDFPVPNPASASLLGSLYIGFDHSAYYYEILDMFRRVLLTSMFSIIPSKYPDVHEKHGQDNPFLLMMYLLIIIMIFIAVQGIVQPYAAQSTNSLAMALQLCLFFTIASGLCLEVSGAAVNSTEEATWQGRCMFFSTFGYVLGALSILYELYFGKMFAEMAVYNSNLPQGEDKMTTREWMTFYNAKLREKLHLTKHGHASGAAAAAASAGNAKASGGKDTTKVVPAKAPEGENVFADDSAENSALRAWG